MHFGLEGISVTGLWVAEIVGFLLSVFWRPSIGLYLIIPLMPLQTVRYRIHGYFLGQQFIDVLLLGVILGLRRQGRPIFPKTPMTALFFTYVIFTYLSMVRGSFFLGVDLPLWFSDDRVSEWKNYVVVLPMLFFLIVSAIRTRKQMALLLIVMCLGLLAVAKNFHGYMGDKDFSSFSYETRTSGTMGYAGVNGLAAFEVQAGVLLIALFLGCKGFISRLGYLGVIVSCIYCVTYALSRGAYAALLVGLLFLGAMRHRILLVGVILFLMGWEGVVPPAVRDRIYMTKGENGEVEHSAASRISLWEEAMQVFEADPIFGTGFNTYSWAGHYGGYRDTHNLWVKVLVETGATGLILFLVIFWRLSKMGLNLYHSAVDPFLQSLGLGFTTLMLAAFIANMFGDRWMFFQITGYTFAFAALVQRGQEISDEEQTAEDETELEPAFAGASLVGALG